MRLGCGHGRGAGNATEKAKAGAGHPRLLVDPVLSSSQSDERVRATSKILRETFPLVVVVVIVVIVVVIVAAGP
jgi:hypothetical protein